MKKLLMIGMVLLFIFIAFSGCNNINDPDSLTQSSYLIISNDKIEINVQYLRTEDHENPFSKEIFLVASTNELEKYYDENRRQIWDGAGNILPDEYFLNAIKKYSEIYFKENFIVIVRLTEGSGSVRHKVNKIDENGNIFIKRILPEEGTDDMATWSILIEINKNYMLEKYQVVLENKQK